MLIIMPQLHSFEITPPFQSNVKISFNTFSDQGYATFS